MKYILSIITIAVPAFFWGQQIEVTTTDRVQYTFEGVTHNVFTFEITNSSPDNIVIWLDEDMNIKGEEAFKRYWTRTIGDFSLFTLIYEHGSTLFGSDNFIPVVYETFYKLLAPNESFCIIFNCIEKYEEVIPKIKTHILPLNDVSYFHPFSYKPKCIVL